MHTKTEMLATSAAPFSTPCVRNALSFLSDQVVVEFSGLLKAAESWFQGHIAAPAAGFLDGIIATPRASP
jgi:hypothetical protein